MDTQDDTMKKVKCVIIDNYDSFTYNLVHLLRELGAEVAVKQNDKFALEDLEEYDKIVLSPGPGVPSEAGLLLNVIRRYAATKPMLGVCLGHQAIAEVFGGKLGLAPKVMHGKQSNINFEAPSVLYQGIEDGRAVMRYHSILIEEMPEDFEVTARSTDDQAIMGIQHKSLPIYGFQYHPESIGTPDGLSSIRNFIEKVVK